VRAWGVGAATKANVNASQAALPGLIVTRPHQQALAQVAELRVAGLHAQALPLIDIAAADDPAPLLQAWQALAANRLVMFVSANAVQHFFAARPTGAVWPPEVLAGSTGPGTSAALLAAGVPAAQLVQPAAPVPPAPPQWDTEALWARLQHLGWAGRRVLVVRGEGGRDWLADTLRAHGASVAFVAAYRRLPPQPDAAALVLLADAQARPQRWYWLFSSSEAVAHLVALVPGADWRLARAWASHPRIEQAARQAGFGQVQPMPANATEMARRMHADAADASGAAGAAGAVDVDA
jgi:uroporphyrinogen-III synthase